MKKIVTKIVLMVACTTFVASTSFAKGHGYGPAGCGLGSVVMGKESQVLAATTNGTAGSQTFGITSGTSNCTDDGTTKTSMVVPMFIEANRMALANDIARGSGETVANLSEVLGCQSSQDLASTLQKNYRTIFPTEKAETATVTDSIIDVVKASKLACKNVS